MVILPRVCGRMSGTDWKADTMAKAQETKEGGGEEDLSMEEILQSIRKIIAEDDNEGKKVAAPDNAKANGQKGKGEIAPGSDVLELTEMVKEDGSTESIKKDAAAAPADVLNKIDEALTPAKPAEKPPEKAAEPAKPAEKPPEKPPEPVAAAPAPAAPAPKVETPKDALLSAEASAAAAASLQKLHIPDPEPPPVVTTPAPTFRSGGTVEDMVNDMLRPMMKSWLDINLPPIVERIVEREVKKLTRH